MVSALPKIPVPDPPTLAALRPALRALADPAYRDFNAKLIPGAGPMLGIRIPRLRDIARRIARSDRWRDLLDDNSPDDGGYFEERMLQGMVIGLARCDMAEKLDRVARFVPRIDNWALCDCFCWKLRAAERDPMWHFIQPYFQAAEEFDIRFAVVMATANFVDDDHLEPLLRRLGECRCDAYYASMGVAWAASVCFARFPRQTMAWLAERCPLDEATFRRTIRKIVESYRVAPADKLAVRALRPDTK